MIAIIDSGSTKTDWVIIEKNGKEVLREETIGFNPRFTLPEEMDKEIHNNKKIYSVSQKIKHLYFYGAGCSSQSVDSIIEKILRKLFPYAVINITDDLKGAAYSAYFGKPALICILGTGSNICYFDGNEIKKETHSLGWIIGDEGSGSFLGKKLLNAYFNKKLPEYLSIKFKERYKLTIDELLENVYQKPRANSFVASFNRFIVENKREPFFQNLVYDAMKTFFENQVMAFTDAKNLEINFIGSIAHCYEDILRAVALKYHLTIGEIVKKPINNLVNYHLLYIIPQLQY